MSICLSIFLSFQGEAPAVLAETFVRQQALRLILEDGVNTHATQLFLAVADSAELTR